MNDLALSCCSSSTSAVRRSFVNNSSLICSRSSSQLLSDVNSRERNMFSWHKKKRKYMNTEQFSWTEITWPDFDIWKPSRLCRIHCPLNASYLCDSQASVSCKCIRRICSFGSTCRHAIMNTWHTSASALTRLQRYSAMSLSACSSAKDFASSKSSTWLPFVLSWNTQTPLMQNKEDMRHAKIKL